MPDLPIVAPGYGEEACPAVEDLHGVLCNRTLVNKKKLIASLDVAMRTPFFRFLRILEPILVLIAAGLLLWAFITKQNAGVIIRGVFLLAMVLFFYFQQFYYYPKKAVKAQLLRYARDEGSLYVEDLLYFREENVARRRGEEGELLHMPYEKIRKVVESRDLFVIRTKSKNLIPLDKDGFENGDAEDFRRILAEKAPKAKFCRIKDSKPTAEEDEAD